MAVRSQQLGAFVAIALVVCVLVLVCLSALLGRGDAAGEHDGDGTQASTGEEGVPASGVSEADGSSVTSYASGRPLAEEAERILGAYEGQGSCVLREAGFIDLFGNAWTCTVQGPDWVDVCLVCGDEGDVGSRVRVIRMDVGEWERAYGQVAR